MTTRLLAFVIYIAFGVLAGACGTTSNELTGPTKLTGPTNVQRPGIVAPPTGGSGQPNCAAANAEWAIGSTANNELLEKARLAANAAVARFVMRGQPITAEYLATRLTLETDEQRIVAAVRCG